jgi:hypothetical protein
LEFDTPAGPRWIAIRKKIPWSSPARTAGIMARNRLVTIERSIVSRMDSYRTCKAKWRVAEIAGKRCT